MMTRKEFLCECQIEQNLFNLNAFVTDFRFLCTIESVRVGGVVQLIKRQNRFLIWMANRISENAYRVRQQKR